MNRVSALVVLGCFVLLDGLTTILGLLLGLSEGGLVASRLLYVLGSLYFSLEYLVLSGLFLVLEGYRVPCHAGLLTVGVGPWLAAWHNLGVLLGAVGWVGA